MDIVKEWIESFNKRVYNKIKPIKKERYNIYRKPQNIWKKK